MTNNISIIVINKNVSSVQNNSLKFNIPKNQVTHNYSSFGGFSANVNESELKLLRNDPSKNVILDNNKYHVSLDVSVPQIGGNKTWKLTKNNVNITGTGQTVCIIDTGVNYTDSALGGCYGYNNVSSKCTVIGGYNFIDNTDNPMDDNGHGTHVSGIVASSDSKYKGISPNAKIIMIKAMNSTGGGSNIDIIAGINWCINNASKFNISVISMSLGDNSTHNSYCDNDTSSDGFYGPIETAISKNISVVVAAGNCNTPGQKNCTIGVSAPACVPNVIIAGAVDSLDNIYFMRGALPELMAPGINIISTLINGTFGAMSGTSMSTPYIAGAVALIKQYLELSGQSKIPQEIESVLNDTGKRLDDTADSGYNFSRINVYNAMLSLDVDAPNVTLVSPPENQTAPINNQTFTCNATDWQLANITLKVWNSNGLIYRNQTKNLTGTANQTTFNLTNIDSGTYSWNCLSSDKNGNTAYSASNYTIKVVYIFIKLVSPETQNYTKTNNTNFTCSASSIKGYELSNVTFYLWNNTNLLYNSTKNISNFTNTTTFNYTLNAEGNYSWNCLGINNASNESFGYTNFTIIYDITKPNISSISESTTPDTATIKWATNENANSLILINKKHWGNPDKYKTQHSTIISGLSPSKKYNYTLISCDMAGNCKNISKNFTTKPPVHYSSSSSSRRATITPPSPAIYKASVVQVSKGYTHQLIKNEKINFTIFKFKGGNHALTVNNIGIGYVNLTIESTPINLILLVGQSKKVNLTSKNYYDLLVKLENITNDKAEITIKSISIPIKKIDDVTMHITQKSENKTIANKTSVADDNRQIKIVLLVLLFIISYLLMTRKTKKLKTKKPNKKNGKN